MGQVLKILSLFLLALTLNFCFLTSNADAIVDPLSVPNNKFGIHIITASPDESSPAATLVNTNGDWGYITVLIEQKDKEKDKWQEFFNDLRRRHLIPIVRIATETSGPNWLRPNLEDANSWADFLNSLNWPVKNRYVTVFNEPNQGHEWGGSTDAKGYAQALDKIITALKTRSEDFFVLNAGFDASAPKEPPNFEEEASFLRQMNDEVPGIFERLDGWASHSYPNPNFVGSPTAQGRGTVRTWSWEIQQLRNLGVIKNLPIFITETGWKHAEGLSIDNRLPASDTLSSYYQNAFQNAWNDPQIMAVTPFLLNYQESPFDHFSFKKALSSDYYPFYQTIKSMPKTSGQPVQEIKAQLIKGEIYSSIVAGQSYLISLTFKNTGQSIWGDYPVKLISIQGGSELGIQTVELPKGVKVEPGQDYTFQIHLKAPEGGTFNVKLNLFSVGKQSFSEAKGIFERNKQFDSKLIEFTTEVKEPVILRILTKLKWKESSVGEYILRVSGAVGDSTQAVKINSNGKSELIEARYLLPDYSFNFTLEKPYYHPKTLHQTLNSGVNVLNFGTLEPNIISALLHPKQLWKLLPLSN